jgi:transcriptional regulator with XRE-family HTH domain
MPKRHWTYVDDPVALGARLKAAREHAGLSQRQLAFPGCTAAYISRLEAGARVPSLQMVNQLAARLDVSGQWLATGVEPTATVATRHVSDRADVIGPCLAREAALANAPEASLQGGLFKVPRVIG